ARGKLPEARLIWARYQLIIGRRLGEQEDGFQWVLKTIYSTVIGSRCSAMDVVELVEKDVMPSALLAGLDHSLCVEWLMQLAQYVETAEPTDFPENSLTIASIMVCYCYFIGICHFHSNKHTFRVEENIF
uniref:KNTC1 first ARM-repeats domain-containing protein n=1 Tax=Plectus sambesii TaxID=2011161 RepID=A0A914VI07_9BILA